MKVLRGLCVACLGAASALSTTAGFAAEEYDKFLAGLRQRQYYDAALDYLTVMANSPLLSETQKQLITFEEARTNLEAARNERDGALRERLLDGAQVKFKEFAEKFPTHVQAASATTQLGAVLVERGRAKLEQGLAPGAGDNRGKLMEEARKYFGESEKVFTDAQKKFEEDLAKYPKFMAPNDPRVIERERVKGDLIQSHMFHAYGLYEKSRTYKQDDDKEKKLWEAALRTAADKYGEIYKNYRTLIAGLAARLKEGQCYQELKDTKRALGLYADLLGQPDDLKPLRAYKASAMYLSLQCWNEETERLFELAYRQGDEFIKGSEPGELSRPEWLAVRYYTAVSHKNRIAQLKKEKLTNEETTEKQRCFDMARQNAEIVASTQGEYQDAARALLKELLGDVDQNALPKSFVEAQNRGLDSMNQFSQMVVDAGKLTVPEERAAKEKEANEARQKAVDFFNMAMKLRDENTSLEDMNTVRYYLCYLAYTEGRTYDAAVIGEFLLKYYPNSGGARQGAQIALASYVTEYQNGTPGPGKDFDAAKMRDMAGQIAKRWAGQKEADDAWNILLAIAMSEKKIPEMLDALNHITPESTVRADAEMKAGRTLWALYGEQLTLDENAPNKLEAKAMGELAQQAHDLLNAAIERQKSGLDSIEKLTLQQAETLMYLCEARIALGKYAEALDCIDNEKYGLLALVRNKEKNADANSDPVPIESYKLALQAYVLNGKVAEAQKLIPELDALSAGGSGDQKAQLANTYLNLALKLEAGIAINRENKNFDALKGAAQGFSFFLDQVAAAGDAFQGEAKFQNLNWVSENYFRLGSDLVTQPNVAAADKAKAQEYFKKSSELDDKLTPLTGEGTDAQLIVKLRKARAMRRSEKYVEAVGALADVLRGRRNLMEAQIEACETLMERAANLKQPHIYATAVNGSRPDGPDGTTGDNIIWGWRRISDTMRQSPPFNDPKDASHKEFQRLYHTARYNMAMCAYQQALAQTAKEERDKLLKAADYYITITQQHVPDLGGPEWAAKYQDLQKKAQNALKS